MEQAVSELGQTETKIVVVCSEADILLNKTLNITKVLLKW